MGTVRIHQRLQPRAAENTLFQEAAAQGQSIFSASGDDGAEDCFPENPTPQVDDPASQPFVTGVGGTHVSSLGPRPAESVWNDGPIVGAGGRRRLDLLARCRSTRPPRRPRCTWSTPGSSGSTCGASSGNCREVPDVSADSDPATGYVIYWNGNGASGLAAPQGWQVVGGTSGAAPAWAALIALANASSACDGTAIGFANPALYNAAATAYAADFNDTTSGDNDMTGTNGGQFVAGPGYDMATGLGSPNGATLAPAMCTDAIALANPGAQRSTSSARRSASRSMAPTPAGHRQLQRERPARRPGARCLDAARITGHPRHLGTSTVTVTASDTAGTSAHTSFAWTIQANPTLSRLSLSAGRRGATQAVLHGRGGTRRAQAQDGERGAAGAGCGSVARGRR